MEAKKQQSNPSLHITSQQSSRKHGRRESTHHWTVDAIDPQDHIKRLRLKTREVLSLSGGDRIMLEFDYKDRAIGEAQGLLAGLSGLLATDCSLFSVSNEKWPDIPKSYFNDCFDNIIKTAETGRRPGRGQLYISTHTKQNGAYITEEAREICEKIKLALSESIVDESEISPNDAAGKVLEKEHPERVRCMGLGVVPSNSFKQTDLRAGGIKFSSSNDVGSSSGCQAKYDKLLGTLKAYILMKEGAIPEQFTERFASTSLMPSDASSGHISPMEVGRSSGDSNPNEDHRDFM